MRGVKYWLKSWSSGEIGSMTLHEFDIMFVV